MIDKNIEKDLKENIDESEITEDKSDLNIEEKEVCVTDEIVDEVLNSKKDSKKTEEKIKLKDIQDKRFKDLTKEERKVALGHLLIITFFILLTVFIVVQFIDLDADDRVIDSSQYSDILNEPDVKPDSEYTRYITEDTLDDIDENSKWKKDKELNEKLQEVMENQEKLDEMNGYELQGELE